MKLIALLCIEEYAEEARKLFRELKVPAYSESEIRGYKLTEDDESENWFAHKHVLDNSHMFFTMCSEEKALELMAAIDTCKENKRINSVHAFQLNIEKFIG